MRRLPLRSPPRMRGKAKNRCRSCPLTRITPAYAGKSRCNLPSTAPWKDHPRVCGEKDTSTVCQVDHEGSPPRMRGKVAFVFFAVTLNRITPAYAGKSATGKETSKRWRDHPRVCGEKTLRNLHGCYLRGSPPRMRGKEKGVTFLPNIPRITPAYAGKRSGSSL